MVARRVPRDEFYLWASVQIPLDAPAFISYLQPIEGLELPARSNFLSVRPSVTAKRVQSSGSAHPGHVAHGVQGSLNVKWRVNPELVIDGTLKPDFSQVELDVPQLTGNVSFALNLAEKRPFFFEGSDLLHSPTEVLYTRSFTAPRWGLRSTWRDDSLAGTALAVDDEGGGVTLLPDAYGTRTAVQPGSRTLAVRALGEVGAAGQFQLGGVIAARRYQDGRGDNIVAGPDFVWQASDAWRLHGQWLVSQTTAQPDPSGSLSTGAATSGASAWLKLTRQTDRSQLDFALYDVAPGFRHDTGFVNQVGFRRIDLHQALVLRELGPTNEFWLRLRERITRDHRDDRVIDEALIPGVSLSAAHNTNLVIDYVGLSRVRVASAGALLSQRYWHLEASTTPADRAPLVSAVLDLGHMADFLAGSVRPGGQLNLSMQLRPLARLEVEPSAWVARLTRDGQVIYRETASQLLGVWHFDARQNLRLIRQRSTYERRPDALAPIAVAADRKSGLTSSLTYTFRRSVGTVFHVGATHSRSGIGAQGIARGTEAFVKLQVDIDEMRALFH